MKNLAQVVVVLMGLVSVSVWADSVPTAGTSSLDSESFWKRTTLSFDMRFYGPSVTNWGSYQPDTLTGQPNLRAKDKSEEKLALGYKLTSDLTVGAAAQTYFYPVLDYQFVWKDPYLFVKRSKMIDADGVRLDAGAKFYAGLGAASQLYQQYLGTRFEGDLSYQAPGSRFRYDLYSYVQKDFSTSTSPLTWSWEGFITPSVEYQTSPSLSALINYKSWVYQLSRNSFTDWNTDQTLLGVGLVWNMRPGLFLNPYLDFSTGKRIAWDTTQVGAYLNWRIY